MDLNIEKLHAIPLPKVGLELEIAIAPVGWGVRARGDRRRGGGTCCEQRRCNQSF